MKKVFAITCHRVTKPLELTINYLSKFKENIILIHVDKKTCIEHFSIAKKKNIIFIEERHKIIWGHISQVDSVLSLMNFAKKYDYNYFYLISGDDIPLCSNEQMNDFLAIHAGKQFISYQDKRYNYCEPLSRILYKHPGFLYTNNARIDKRIYRFLFRKFLLKTFCKNKNVLNVINQFKVPKLYKGTNWFTISSDAVNYILEYIKANSWYYDLFVYSYCSDEVFFHTILKTNHDFKFFTDNTAQNDCLRYIDWKSGPQYPRILDSTDYEKMKYSNAHFARKMKSDLDISDFVDFITDSK